MRTLAPSSPRPPHPPRRARVLVPRRCPARLDLSRAGVLPLRVTRAVRQPLLRLRVQRGGRAPSGSRRRDGPIHLRRVERRQLRRRALRCRLCSPLRIGPTRAASPPQTRRGGETHALQLVATTRDGCTHLSERLPLSGQLTLRLEQRALHRLQLILHGGRRECRPPTTRAVVVGGPLARRRRCGGGARLLLGGTSGGVGRRSRGRTRRSGRRP